MISEITSHFIECHKDDDLALWGYNKDYLIWVRDLADPTKPNTPRYYKNQSTLPQDFIDSLPGRRRKPRKD